MKELDERPFPVRVECYSGYRGEETPRRFYVGERQVEVAEMVGRWLAPDHRYFRVRGDDGDVYILRHDAERDLWELTEFTAGGAEPTKCVGSLWGAV